MSWKIKQIGKKPKLDKPVLIEGLPGIGNVGKVAVDFMIDELNAVKLYELFSYTFPHSVFVNEKNLVELPSTEIYYKKRKDGPDLLLLAGDVQPIDEISCYEFSEKILDIMKEECKKLGYSSMTLPSGAGHDAQILASVSQPGMIFIPCLDGISHSPLETIEWEDLEKGANLLLQVILRLAH